MATDEDLRSADNVFADLDALSTQGIIDSLDYQALAEEQARKLEEADEGDSGADDAAEPQESQPKESQAGTGAKKAYTRQPVLVTRAKAVQDAEAKVARKAKLLDEKRAAQEKKQSAEAAEKVARAEEDLKKAKEALVTAEQKLATSTKNALANKEKEEKKAAQKQQRIALDTVDCDIAAQVVLYVFNCRISRPTLKGVFERPIGDGGVALTTNDKPMRLVI
jgi:hypothetical protein